MKPTKALIGLALACSAAVAQPQSTPLAGVTVGVFLPTDGEIRDLVGNSFLQLGFSPSVGVSKAKFSIRPELSFLGGSGNGNRFSIFALPITAIMPLGLPGQETVPYLAIGAGPTYFDYNITRPGPTNFRDRGIGWLSHVEAGVVFGDRMRLSARYNMLGEKDGFNFNGVQIGLSWQFIRL